MSRPSVIVDEDFGRPVAEALRERGFSVVAAVDLPPRGLADDEQLRHAARVWRVNFRLSLASPGVRPDMPATAPACDDRRMKAYIGERARDGTVRVRVEQGGAVRALAHATRHDPDRFDYGYDGSGPAGLARSILADYLGYTPRWRVYRAFLHQFIVPLDRSEPWTITETEISAWLVLIGVGGRGEADALESR